MAKKNPTTAARATKADTDTATTANAVALDWSKEAATMMQAAKEKGGSRGDQLGKVAQFISVETPASLLIRAAASKPAPAINGAQAIIELSRNVLAKLPKLAGRLADGQPFCSLDQLTERRTGDASVAVAIGSLGAGDERQKAVVASAASRYPAGGNAQMPAALEALRFMGIIERKETGSVRNAEYVIVDKDAADKLIPRA